MGKKKLYQVVLVGIFWEIIQVMTSSMTSSMVSIDPPCLRTPHKTKIEVKPQKVSYHVMSDSERIFQREIWRVHV